MRLTVGPLPPSVYWRRRVLVLGAALLVLFLVAQACMAATAAPGADGGGGGDSPTSPPPTDVAATSPATSAVDQPSDAVEPGEGQSPGAQPGPQPVSEECTDDDMLITAEANPTEFVAGDPVRFRIRIRNSSDRTCLRDIGGGQRELYLIQGTGATKVWSTRLCGAPTGSEVTRLDPGFETDHYIDWSGQTSSTCAGGQPAGPLVSPGSYQLFARLGTAYSEPLPITIG